METTLLQIPHSCWLITWGMKLFKSSHFGHLPEWPWQIGVMLASSGHVGCGGEERSLGNWALGRYSTLCLVFDSMISRTVIGDWKVPIISDIFRSPLFAPGPASFIFGWCTLQSKHSVLTSLSHHLRQYFMCNLKVSLTYHYASLSILSFCTWEKENLKTNQTKSEKVHSIYILPI